MTLVPGHVSYDGGRSFVQKVVLVDPSTGEIASQTLTLIEDEDETGEAFAWPGGDGLFVANGTWDSATVSLEAQLEDGDDWQVLGPEVALTEDGSFIFTLPACNIRAAVADAGTESITVKAKRV